MCVVISDPGLVAVPHTTNKKKRETKLRRSGGHSEIPTHGAILLLVLCGPLGSEGLISWGARNDACPVVGADATTAHRGIKLK